MSYNEYYQLMQMGLRLLTTTSIDSAIMFIGMIDLRKGLMEFCNCGHNAPILDANLKNLLNPFLFQIKFLYLQLRFEHFVTEI